MQQIDLVYTSLDLLDEFTERQLETLVGHCYRKRLRRFHRHEDALRSLLGRSLVLCELYQRYGQWCRIEKTKFGKPYVSQLPIHFSITHTADTVAAAFSGLPVGVDAERVCENQFDLDEFVFRGAESARVQEMDEEQRKRTFYRIWAQKESIQKYLGMGMYLPMTEIEVGPDGRCLTHPPLRTLTRYLRDNIILSVCGCGDMVLHLRKVALRTDERRSPYEKNNTDAAARDAAAVRMYEIA